MSLTEAQFKLADSLRWFHALDFGDYQTRGRFMPDVSPTCFRNSDPVVMA